MYVLQVLSSVQHVAEVAVIGIKVSACACAVDVHTLIHTAPADAYIYSALTHTRVYKYTIYYTRIPQDAYRGQVPLGLLVLNEPTPEHPTIDSDAVIQHAIDAVRHKIGAFAVFKKAVIVEKLPKTRSGMCVIPFRIPVKPFRRHYVNVCDVYEKSNYDDCRVCYMPVYIHVYTYLYCVSI